MPHPDHLAYMQRALQLARSGAGSVSPNPMVGCVIVKNGYIIGEGYHKQYGGPHAEVNAAASVTDCSLLPGSDFYVTLEPCSHFGKTPPCAQLLVSLQPRRVFISNPDPNPLVNGTGISHLKQAGIEVISGLAEAEGRELNKRFFTRITKNRPYIILKWAQSADGFMGRTGEQVWISNPLAKALVHKWRSREDAVLIGSGTLLTDNPLLTVRNWSGRNPVRVILAGSSNLAVTGNALGPEAETIIFSRGKVSGFGKAIVVQLPPDSAGLWPVLEELNRLKIQSVLVEGGRKVLESFLNEGLWDEANVFVAPETTLQYGIKAPKMSLPEKLPEKVGNNLLYTFLNG